MIPAYFKTDEISEPAAPCYHLVTASGTFLVRKTALFSSVTSAGAIPGLAPEEESCRLFFPPVPRAVMEQLYGFFQAAYDEWGGEAVAVLHYAPESRSFAIAVPPQLLFRQRWSDGWRTEKRVVYGHVPRPKGFLKLGDAHSHADFPAFFSCTDDQDDAEDGLRIVLGDLDRLEPSISVSFIASGTRFTLRPEDILEGLSAPITPPQEWMERIVCLGERDHEAGPNGDA